MVYEIILAIAIGITIGITIYFIIDIFKSFREIRKFGKIGNDMPRYRWLMRMGMQEQAGHFNAFGLRIKNWITNKKL